MQRSVDKIADKLFLLKEKRLEVAGMDMKINQLLQSQPIEQTQQQVQTDGSFKFTLVSHIEEAQLQERLTAMMEQITMQGEKLAKHRDVKDMKRYRGLIKEFLNEVVYHLYLCYLNHVKLNLLLL